MAQRINWRHQYDEDRDAEERAATDITCEDQSKTQQHFAIDADLNEIARRFGITDGAILPAVADPRFYGDFSNAVDFRTALDLTRNARERFEQLPADIRSRFHHDPVELFNFVSDPKNDEEAIKLGLLKRNPVLQDTTTVVSPST